MTESDLRHLEDDSAPISDEERRAAAAEIRRLRGVVDERGMAYARLQSAYMGACDRIYCLLKDGAVA